MTRLVWEEIPGDQICAALSVAGPYVISHWWKFVPISEDETRKVWYFNLSYRPPNEHHHVGAFDTLDEAKGAAEEHAVRTKTAADWAEEMAKLRERKPRPLHKRFGANSTEAQIAEHREAERTWNRDYRHASKMQKKTLAEENAKRLT